MYDAPPDLSEADVDALVARVPELQQRPFRGWLEGTLALDGEAIEVTVQ